jgi:hypothetical protein
MTWETGSCCASGCEPAELGAENAVLHTCNLSGGHSLY